MRRIQHSILWTSLHAVLLVGMLAVLTPTPAMAQVPDTSGTVETDRSATGGAPTLEDIMRRQEGLKVDNDHRAQNTGNPDAAAGLSEQLGTLGGASDPDLWRSMRFNSADISTQSRSPASDVLI